jgi:23S rRNA (uridine2552-2'-O)-methyltransferase
LIEIQQKDRVLKPGMTVIDLGAAPGGWSQYAVTVLGSKGRMIALDILPIEPLPGIEFIQGDFRENEVLHQLLQSLGDSGADLVLSDMAPNTSGMDAVDVPRAYYLAELALDFARQVLKPGGGLLVKLFQGDGFEAYHNELKQHFSRVVMRKPKASRARSREIYALAAGFKAE